MIPFGPAGAQRVMESSAPYRLISSWLQRFGLSLPKLGQRLTPEVETAITELGTTEDGKAFSAVWSAMNGEPVFSRVTPEDQPS